MASSILVVTHVPIHESADGTFIDEQTARGIAQWRKHFDRVTYVGMTAEGAGSSSAWVALEQQLGTADCRTIVLPDGYALSRMIKHYRSVRKTLRGAIAEHEHLCFTIGGLIGDWPAIAALEARKQKRDYVVWIDRVEPQIIRQAMAGSSLKRRVKSTIELPLMDRYQRFILGSSRRALLQGMDTFNYFRASAPDPHCIYDTHTTATDQIGAAQLQGKLARIRSGAPLEIVYTGRAATMKGTGDWLGVLEILNGRGVPFRARWIGDGPDIDKMRQRVEAASLGDKIMLPGFETDREKLLAALRDSDMLLFCHKTMESARCLIETLVSGCPMVGYDSAYAKGLAEEHGGALLTPRDDVEALAGAVVALHFDRARLARLVEQAAQSGEHYDEDAVYAHRARLMGAGA
nr:glycosyltransferase [uncultured Devosia sp.]